MLRRYSFRTMIIESQSDKSQDQQKAVLIKMINAFEEAHAALMGKDWREVGLSQAQWMKLDYVLQICLEARVELGVPVYIGAPRIVASSQE